MVDEVWTTRRNEGRNGKNGEPRMETRKRTMSTNDMNGTFVSVQPDRWYVNICDDLAVVELLKNKDVWLKPGMIYSVSFKA